MAMPVDGYSLPANAYCQFQSNWKTIQAPLPCYAPKRALPVKRLFSKQGAIVILSHATPQPDPHIYY